MSDFHVVAAALSARREELTGEASPLDYDGARLVLRSLEKAGYSVVPNDGGAAAPPAATTGAATPAAAECATQTAAPPSLTGPGPVAVIGGQPGPALPPEVPRAFELFRHVDISGVSGTGPVAWGVLFPDGSVAVRWQGAHPSTAAWPSLADIVAVHGHGGATEVRWFDGVSIDMWPTGGEDR